MRITARNLTTGTSLIWSHQKQRAFVSEILFGKMTPGKKTKEEIRAFLNEKPRSSEEILNFTDPCTDKILLCCYDSYEDSADFIFTHQFSKYKCVHKTNCMKFICRGGCPHFHKHHHIVRMKEKQRAYQRIKDKQGSDPAQVYLDQHEDDGSDSVERSWTSSNWMS